MAFSEEDIERMKYLGIDPNSKHAQEEYNDKIADMRRKNAADNKSREEAIKKREEDIQKIIKKKYAGIKKVTAEMRKEAENEYYKQMMIEYEKESEKKRQAELKKNIAFDRDVRKSLGEKSGPISGLANLSSREATFKKSEAPVSSSSSDGESALENQEFDRKKTSKKIVCTICNTEVSKCDVCGKKIEDNTEIQCFTREKKHFCSQNCAHKFAKDVQMDFSMYDMKGNLESDHQYSVKTPSSGSVIPPTVASSPSLSTPRVDSKSTLGVGHSFLLKDGRKGIVKKVNHFPDGNYGYDVELNDGKSTTPTFLRSNDVDDNISYHTDNSADFEKRMKNINRYRVASFLGGMGSKSAGEAAEMTKGGGWMAAGGLAMQYAQKKKEEKKQQDLIDAQTKSEKERLKDLRKGGKSLSAPSDDKWSSGWTFFMLLLALFAHLYDAQTGFVRNPPPMTLIIIYIIIVIISFFFASKMHFSGDEAGMLGAIALCIILPYAASYLSGGWQLTLGGLIIYFPILVLYMMFKFPERSGVLITARLYIVFWIIMGIFYLLTAPFSLGADGKQMLKTPWDAAGYTFDKVAVQPAGKMWVGIQREIDLGIARATGQQYDGQQESEGGVYLTDLKPIESTFYQDQEVWVQAKISAKNVNGTVGVDTTCIADGQTMGEVYPKTINLSFNDENYIDCKFASLPVGSHEISLKSTFDYKSDATIEYTFVNNFVRQEDYSKLKIQTVPPIATYTGGPIKLGLPALNQPLRVNTAANIPEPADYPFGVSLSNKWGQGKILRGDFYQLNVPSSITLQNCNRNVEGSAAGIVQDERRTYKFSINSNNAKNTFDSVSCRMHVTDIDALLSADLKTFQKSVKTFVGSASYTYELDATTTVVVAES